MERDPATHAAHDELVLARLFGGDLEGLELQRAREMAASCDGCAAVLADFKAVAEAAASLPVPPRPRDFTISASQARRLRRGRGWARPKGLRAVLGRLGPVRSLGVSMAAAGVAGILVVGALSTLGQSGSFTLSNRQADQPAAAGGDSSQKGAAAPNASTAFVAVQSPVPEDAQESGGNVQAEASPTAGSVSDDAYGPEVDAGGGTENPPPSPQQPDSGPPWALVFGGLAAAGLVLLAVPTAVRRYAAGRR